MPAMMRSPQSSQVRTGTSGRVRTGTSGRAGGEAGDDARSSELAVVPLLPQAAESLRRAKPGFKQALR